MLGVEFTKMQYDTIQYNTIMNIKCMYLFMHPTIPMPQKTQDVSVSPSALNSWVGMTHRRQPAASQEPGLTLA